MLIFIPGAVPSSKNSRIRTKSGLFIASKATQTWRKNTMQYWSLYRRAFVEQCIGKSQPFFVGLHFVRGTKHRWDFINPCQTVQDEMTHHGWIADDSVEEMLPLPLMVDGSYWSYDKNHAGVYIKVLSTPEEANFNFSKTSVHV